jgi:hypothetical protein
VGGRHGFEHQKRPAAFTNKAGRPFTFIKIVGFYGCLYWQTIFSHHKITKAFKVKAPVKVKEKVVCLHSSTCVHPSTSCVTEWLPTDFS